METLNYRPGDKFSTIAPTEPDLQTITAERYVQAYEENYTLEGVNFDRDGYMYFTCTMGYAVWKVDMKTKEKTRIFHEEGVRPAAVKVHKDGRLFVACVSNETLGGIFTMNPDGSDVNWIIRGYSVDDLVFDSEGGFYFTHFVGNFREPDGGVYYVYPGYNKIRPFAKGMYQPNGIALSRDESILWVTEFQGQRLHRFNIKTGRACIPYRFTGFAGPDSCSIDADDNLYVACPDQGRILVFNFFGSPIGQVVMPRREQGHNLFTTHPMVKPGTRELYITVADKAAEDCEGGWIYVAGAFAEGNDKAYQYQ